MATHIRCGKLFTGLEDVARSDWTVVVEGERIAHVGPTAEAPEPAARDRLVDHGRHFVMPGLIEGHSHLICNNAPTEEDVEIYTPLELRTLIALINAQRALLAGCTTVLDAGGSARALVAIRDAINAGMYVGPRVYTAGQYLTGRQGAPDMFPRWFENPTSVRRLIHGVDDGIEAIRQQVKDGVDFIKFHMDGRTRNLTGGIAACFSEDETRRLIDECHRLGKRVKVHAKGAEAALYGARSGCAAIAHAPWLDDEALEAVRAAGTMLNPQLTLIHNAYAFTQPTDGLYFALPRVLDEWKATVASMKRARAMGIPIMVGIDAGFDITAAGEWHALELKLLVEHVGLTPAEALRAATSVNAAFFGDGKSIGALEAGRFADILAVDGDPLADVGVLLDKTKLAAIYKGGDRIDITVPPINMRKETDRTYRWWREIYDQKRVAELQAAAAE